MLLMALPTKVQIVIKGHLAVTSMQPMDDLRSLRATYSAMHHIWIGLGMGGRGIQTIFMESTASGHASMISPTPLMASTIWQPIWSPYCSIGAMPMPAMMPL